MTNLWENQSIELAENNTIALEKAVEWKNNGGTVFFVGSLYLVGRIMELLEV